MTDSTELHVDVQRQLAAATELAREGRCLQAMDDLSAMNRLHRDPAVEHRLVELRHQAFAEVSKAAGRPTWPAVFPDPFPDVDGLPEVDAARLSGELLGGSITNHGCLHVRGLVDLPTVERLRSHIERSFEARERFVAGADPASVEPWFVPFAPGRDKAERFARDKFIRAVDAPSALWEISELFARVGLTRTVTDYFQERPAMIANKWVLRRSPSGVVGTDFHQDGAFLGAGIRTVDCWIALSHCGPGTERPAMDIIPKRFDGVLDDHAGATFPWSLAEAALGGALADVPLCSPVFEEGDALLFDELLPHRTTQGLDLTTRYAIESWFVAPSSYPDKHLPVVL